MELFAVVGTLRCRVPARVQRAEPKKECWRDLVKPLRRCQRRGQRSALSLTLGLSKE
jgi:hypothetical protein